MHCKGGIQAHHIYGWTEFPKQRFNVNNGITLCLAHHPRKRAEETKLREYVITLINNQE